MIKKYVGLIYILWMLLGCGAQQRSEEEGEVEMTMDGNSSEIVLPQKLSIPFPLELFSLTEMNFHQDIKQLDKKIKRLEDKVSALNALFPKIVQSCEGRNPCWYSQEHDLSFKRIEFFKNGETAEYAYQLLLVTDSFNTIILQWREESNNVLTTYATKSNTLILHYVDDLLGERGLYIKENEENKHIGMLVHTKEMNIEYHLSSNHINLKEESFSSNILLQNDELREYNENIFPVEILPQELEQGDFLLFNGQKNVEKLTFIEQLNHTAGLFSLFQNRREGFLYNALTMEEVEDLEVLQLK